MEMEGQACSSELLCAHHLQDHQELCLDLDRLPPYKIKSRDFWPPERGGKDNSVLFFGSLAFYMYSFIIPKLLRLLLHTHTHSEC